MIAEIKFKNFYSFQNETVFSFEADKSTELEQYHVVEITPGVRLLKLGVIYGANASGKSNLIRVWTFLRDFFQMLQPDKTGNIPLVPFLLNKSSKEEPSEFSLTFYTDNNDNEFIKYTYSLYANRECVIKECLNFYPSRQPTNIFERELAGNTSTLKFGSKIKVPVAVRNEIVLKCLPNISVFAAYQQVNANIEELETATRYLRHTFSTFAITSTNLVSTYHNPHLNEEEDKKYILQYLREADFNISDIYQEGIVSDNLNLTRKYYRHQVTQAGTKYYFDLPEMMESNGTVRTFRLSGYIYDTIKSNGFIAIDEIESSLHPKLIEYIIERFLKEAKHSQLLFTTHYDGLLTDEDLIRKDNIWFTAKDESGSSELYPLTDFKGLNRISSLQMAYRLGKFGAIPNI